MYQDKGVRPYRQRLTISKTALGDQGHELLHVYEGGLWRTSSQIMARCLLLHFAYRLADVPRI